MKKIIVLAFFFIFSFSCQLSLAAYPTACPNIAQIIVGSFGGCSLIDCVAYSDICAKCCAGVAAPAQATTTTSLLEPLTATTPESLFQIKSISSYGSSSPAFVPLIQENYLDPQNDLVATATPTEIATSTPGREPIVVLIEFVKSIFAVIFRIFGFGR